jgi:hypothetical protein
MQRETQLDAEVVVCKCGIMETSCNCKQASFTVYILWGMVKKYTFGAKARMYVGTDPEIFWRGDLHEFSEIVVAIPTCFRIVGRREGAPRGVKLVAVAFKSTLLGLRPERT